MTKIFIFALAIFLFLPNSGAMAADKPLVAIKTDLGTFVIELDPREAPETVKNF